MAKPLPQISLQQYAGIQAALAEGHDLDTVLEREGVPAWRWPELDLQHTEAVTRDEELFQRYSESLIEAEEILTRDVTPLHHDISAWSGFTAALCADGAMLERHGLAGPDVKRLVRHWNARIESDSGLARRAEELAASPPPPPAELIVEDAVLRRFPWSPPEDTAKATTALEPLAFLAETKRAKGKPKGAPIPFAGRRPVPPGTLAIEPNPMLGQTAPLGAKKKRLPPTPFERQPEPAPMPASPPPPVQRSTRLEPNPLLAGTAPLRPGAPSPAVPFSGKRAAPPSAVSSLEPVAELGQTAPIGAKRPRQATNAWTPEHYGRFCAELDAAGAHRGEVLARWGITSEAEHRDLERYWRERFQADPSLRVRFLAALDAGS